MIEFGAGSGLKTRRLLAGQDTPNLVIVKVGADGNVKLYNNAGTGHLIADVVGYDLRRQVNFARSLREWMRGTSTTPS